MAGKATGSDAQMLSHYFPGIVRRCSPWCACGSRTWGSQTQVLGVASLCHTGVHTD